MQKLQIWHNPSCSKSKDAKSLIENKNISMDIRNYLENPPTKEELVAVLEKLNLSAKDIIRTKEDIYKELNLENISNEDELIEIIIKNPILIERPIIILGNKAVIARPIEKLSELLNAI